MMEQLIEAIEGCQPARVKALVRGISAGALDLAFSHLEGCIWDSSHRDWGGVVQALFGAQHVRQEHKTSVLFEACRAGCISAAQACVQAGCSLELAREDQHGRPWASRTPLTVAAEQNHTELLGYLIGQGLDVNQVDSKGESPLMVAVGGENCEAFEVLLAAGADIHQRYRGQTDALHHLINRVQFNRTSVDGLRMATMLIEAGLHLSMTRGGGESETARQRMLGDRTMAPWVPVLDAFQTALDMQRDTAVSHQERATPRL